MPARIKVASDILHYRLDSLVLRKGRVCGHGWAFLSKGPLRRVLIKLSLSSGEMVIIEASSGQKRDDVASMYPDIAQARYSGFAFHSQSQAHSFQSVTLVVETVEQEQLGIPLHIRLDGDKYHISARKYVYLRLVRNAWRLLRQRQFGRLWQAVAQYATRVPRQQQDLVPTLKKLLRNTFTKAALMVIDHDLGGGANMYRERKLASLIGRGESVLVLTFFMPTLQFVLEYRDAHRTRRFALAGLLDIVKIIESGLIREIFYNNAVSFYDPLRIPELLVSLKQRTGISFRLALHDYFCICPSHFLLNDQGRYCDLPPVPECNRCLHCSTEAFVQISGIKDIAVWRERWGRCLEVAEEIICFSEASRAILRRAYPHLSQEKVILRPHTLNYLLQSIPKIKLDASLHIGILGHMTEAKGAAVLSSLVEEIARRGLNVPVTVIGTVDAKYSIPFIKETGSYTPDKLASLIEQSGANLFLFPSIWPETFSYVVAELIALSVPVMCFDIGAPAERVRGYRLGKVVPYNASHTLLDELLSFHASLREQCRNAPIGERI